MYSCYVFTHNTQILYYFWYMCRYNVIWPSQGIYVLMYTHLTCFWSIKLIRLVMCVCVWVCVLDLWMLCIVLWRDVFESLTCWLDLCLSSLLVAFISMCFSSLWKTPFFKLDSFSTDPRQLPIYWAPWTSFLDRFYRIFDPSSFLEYVSIASWSIKKLSIWLIDFRQNLVPSRNFCRRQILDNTSTDSYLDI